ncbi:retrotransposon protein, putative, ty1-copia subclass [Tanacetum coccineum]
MDHSSISQDGVGSSRSNNVTNEVKDIYITPRKHQDTVGISPLFAIARNCNSCELSRLPFEYTITSRSTDVPISLASPTDSEYLRSGMRYMIHNEVACLMLGIGELHAMLIEYEKGLPKKAETPQVMMIKGGKIQKSNKKSLKAKGKGKANGKGNDKQVYIPKPKNPKPSVKEQGGVSLQLSLCTSIIRGVVSVHRLVENGFVQCFTDYGISVSKNNVVYFNAIPSNDSTYLWHYRLAHINKKHIKRLQQEGLLKSINDESFDQCVSCLSGKMTRKSFPHRLERATDLLGIIHTDVCGPLRHVSRQGASYFITFKDDYSRYGYVYLLKYKHEVFETFKVFKNEVENQLKKTIKAIRSDRGGEYISQEFKDYLKANGIVQQLTSPYTPQHNGVSERRNRTLLDMVKNLWGGRRFLKNIKEEEDTTPSESLENIPQEVEGFETTTEEVIRFVVQQDTTSSNR